MAVMLSVNFSSLERILLIHYTDDHSTAIKAREDADSQEFFLIFYVSDYAQKRPAIRLPISEWDTFSAEERRIGPHPYKGYWSKEYPHRHIDADRFYEATYDEVVKYLKKHWDSKIALRNKLNKK